MADTGSVRGAAARLFVTESSVSASIAALAREIGVMLVERHGRGLRLTSAGACYADHARTILGLYERARLAALGEDNPEAGVVRIGAVTTAGEHLLPNLLVSFRALYPNMELGLEVAARDSLWSMFDHREVDIVVAGRPPDLPDATVRAIRPNVLIVVGTPDVAAKFSVSDTTWLLREEGSGARATCLAMLSAIDGKPPTTMTLGSNGAVVAGAVAGLGVTLVSRHAVASLCESGQLVEIPMPNTPVDRPWHAVTHPQTSPSVELLLRHLIGAGGWRPTNGTAPR